MALSPVISLQLSAPTWTDVTADVEMAAGLTGRYGIQGAGPNDRCAGSGSFVCYLRNDGGNSGGLVGYYSPGHANCRAGFDLGILARAEWADGSTTVTRGIGRVIDITPDPGLAGPRRTRVEWVDWFDDAAITTLQDVATQTSKRADEILTAILAGAGTNPQATDFDTGDSTFAYALDNLAESSTTLLTAFASLVRSEGGYLYLEGDGTLRFVKRTGRASMVTAAATFANSQQGMTGGRSRGELVNRVAVVIHPRRIDAAATTVLYSLDTIPLIEAGQVVHPFGPYGDPLNANKRCGGTAMVSPAATTDYTMNTAADGSGTDKTADFTVTASYSASGVRWTITNGAAVAAYITKLQCRGKGIYDYQNLVMEASDSTSIAAHGERLATVDMPYQDDVSTGDGFARQVLALYKSSSSRARTLTFLATDDATAIAAALAVDVGARIAVAETVTGIDAACFVHALAYRWDARGLWITLTLAPAGLEASWILDVQGFSELGDTTTLGYA